MRIPPPFAHEASFPDPFVLRDGHRWVAFATGPAPDGRLFPTLLSNDGVTWTEGPGALDRVGVPGSDHWAPEVALRDGRYHLLYSAGWEDRGHHLRLAIADVAEGPYRDVGAPLLDPAACPFAIDAHPYQDPAGRWWVFYARDLLDGERPGTCLVVSPWDDPLRLPDPFTVVARARWDWQRYQRDRVIHGGVFDWHTLEGPNVVPAPDGRLRLLYSAGNWQNGTYGVDWLEADGPEGPWCAVGEPGRPRVLASSAAEIGPGHNSTVVDDAGQRLIAYHAWDARADARRMRLSPLVSDHAGVRTL